jgi:hypothetical protein
MKSIYNNKKIIIAFSIALMVLFSMMLLGNSGKDKLDENTKASIMNAYANASELRTNCNDWFPIEYTEGEKATMTNEFEAKASRYMIKGDPFYNLSLQYLQDSFGINAYIFFEDIKCKVTEIKSVKINDDGSITAVLYYDTWWKCIEKKDGIIKVDAHKSKNADTVTFVSEDSEYKVSKSDYYNLPQCDADYANGVRVQVDSIYDALIESQSMHKTKSALGLEPELISNNDTRVMSKYDIANSKLDIKEQF